CSARPPVPSAVRYAGFRQEALHLAGSTCKPSVMEGASERRVC
ncbi:MAG: hypothetical protein AVDCRST_MAG37-2288, partial [uncultured Rubrobacteraceae bacterium]